MDSTEKPCWQIAILFDKIEPEKIDRLIFERKEVTRKEIDTKSPMKENQLFRVNYCS